MGITDVLKKREIVILLMLVTWIPVLIDYYFVSSPISTVSLEFQKWAIVLAAFSLILGTTVTVKFHVFRIMRKNHSHWPYSVVLLGSFIVMTLGGVLGGTGNIIYSWPYENLLSPGAATIGLIITFYNVSATYRTFRARNLQALTYMGSCVVMMLYYVPIGELVYAGYPKFGAWLLEVPIGWTAGLILASLTVAMVIIMLRTVLGLEKAMAV